MSKFARAALGVAVVSMALAAAAPAFALGGCGPNYHRNGWGRCVWGGQNEDWCLRHTGHPASPGPGGTKICR